MNNPTLVPALPFAVLGDVATAAHWLRQHGNTLRTDSRHIQPGDVFLAWPGAAHDAREHVLQALQRGAAACLVEADGVAAFDFASAQHAPQWQQQIACYSGLRHATGLIAAAFYGQPSAQVRVLAVTGTNGKTSTAWWLAQALAQHNVAGAGIAGTLGIGRFVQGRAELVDTGLTTPDPVCLQAALRHMAEQGVTSCVMEASSIGIVEQRLAGTSIHTALFTNFTQDHLDYHGTMQAYWQAKRALFDWPELACAVVNVDDPQGAALADELRQYPQLDLWTVSAQPGNPQHARLHASAIRYDGNGLVFEVQQAQPSHTAVLHTQAIGHYNISNLLGVLAALCAQGMDLQAAVQACSHLQAVPGRMQCLGQSGQPLVVVDYAHTPDALDKALQALRPLAQQRGGRLWAVFGCGGDRDPTKRPLMARAAEQHAEQLLITSDNPRTEDPQRIIEQICAGLQQPARALVEADRAHAIAHAISSAAQADVILLAGKGHESYQEIHGVRHPFSDQEYVEQSLQLLANKGV